MQARARYGGRIGSGLALAVLAAALSLSSSALAQRQHRPGPSHFRGDISRFQGHDQHVWRSGHWVRGRHDGRLGWWWTAGGLWYPFAVPVYPYPDPWLPPAVVIANPAETVVPAAPPVQYWYYCDASRTYYPYVASCPGGWRAVPATPSDASPVPQQ